jgi:DNA-3-methyladenine glycosylase
MGWSAPGVTVDRGDLLLPSHEVAPRLLGARITADGEAGAVTVEITEVEAYAGVGLDPASHAHRGPTARNAPMFGEPGTLYVYFVYGMHWCMNVVTGPVDSGAAVLIRSGDVVEGVELARGRRPAARADARLAQGPANLASALGVTGAQNGTDLFADDAPVRLHLRQRPSDVPVASGPRVGISRAVDRPWRWWLEGRPSVSRARSH